MDSVSSTVLMIEEQKSRNLFATAKEEFVGIDSISNRASEEWHPVEHKGGFIWIFEKQLIQYIENDYKYRERDNAC